MQHEDGIPKWYDHWSFDERIHDTGAYEVVLNSVPVMTYLTEEEIAPYLKNMLDVNPR